MLSGERMTEKEKGVRERECWWGAGESKYPEADSQLGSQGGGKKPVRVKRIIFIIQQQKMRLES